MTSSTGKYPEAIGDDRARISLPEWFGRASVLVYLVALAWAPFPLGSDVRWGPPILEILIGIAFALWGISAASRPDLLWSNLKRIAVPAFLALLVFSWVLFQLWPNPPIVQTHPIWQIASETLHRPLAARISINPWHTRLELQKLVLETAACWLAFCFARDRGTARFLFHAILLISASYALYAFALKIFATSQVNLMYAGEDRTPFLTGPFMLHNSFATFCGLGLLVAILDLVSSGRRRVVFSRGFRTLALTASNFAFGSGRVPAAAVLILLSALLASASRAGIVATGVALCFMTFAAVAKPRGTSLRLWPAFAAALAVLICVGLLVSQTETVDVRFSQLANSGEADPVRIELWHVARRMIEVLPWTGLGLGTFQDAYPMFASKVYPFVMDKAHCDYLELGADLGIPATCAWLAALAWQFFLCLRGIQQRRRDALFPLLGAAATVLVGTHSFVDFSLQIPAVALLYATCLGLGVAQSFRGDESRR